MSKLKYFYHILIKPLSFVMSDGPLDFSKVLTAPAKPLNMADLAHLKYPAFLAENGLIQGFTFNQGRYR